MKIRINGEERFIEKEVTVAELLEIVGVKFLISDRLFFSQNVGGAGMTDWEKLLQDDPFEIAGRRFKSRLIIGSGKFKSFQQNREVLEASGAEIITVAVRRVNITDPTKENLLDYIDPKKYLILPNTAGCYTAEEAIKTAMLAREATGINWVKLEVIGDQKTLLPDMEETLKAAKILVKEGFVVLPYVFDDPVYARKFEDVGCAAVMPLASPIGSGLGLQNPYNIIFIREAVSVPVIGSP